MRKSIVLPAIAGTLLTLCGVTSSCNSVPTMRYQQIYDTQGNRYESFIRYDKGTQSPFKTPLATLLELEQNKSDDDIAFREGYFFFQSEETRSRGYGIGDTLNQAAWFILTFKPEAERADYAAKIGTILRNNDTEQASALLDELKKTTFKEGKIRSSVSYHDDNHRFMKSSFDYLQGKSPTGKINARFGIQRTYYENGLVSSEFFCIDDSSVSPVIKYTEEGKIESIK